MSEAAGYIGPERRRVGRRALVEGQRSETISGSVPQDLYAAACHLARSRYENNLSVVVRLALARFILSERKQLPIDK